MQPRLDAAGVRWSVAVVWLCQFAYHAPLIARAGYANSGGFAGGEDQLWLDESGFLPAAGYAAIGMAFFLWMRQHGDSWQSFGGRALTASRTDQ